MRSETFEKKNVVVANKHVYLQKAVQKHKHAQKYVRRGAVYVICYVILVMLSLCDVNQI